jgi:hypothetical protein
LKREDCGKQEDAGGFLSSGLFKMGSVGRMMWGAVCFIYIIVSTREKNIAVTKQHSNKVPSYCFHVDCKGFRIQYISFLCTAP